MDIVTGCGSHEAEVVMASLGTSLLTEAGPIARAMVADHPGCVAKTVLAPVHCIAHMNFIDRTQAALAGRRWRPPNESPSNAA
jgi:hypothetical protein